MFYEFLVSTRVLLLLKAFIYQFLVSTNVVLKVKTIFKCVFLVRTSVMLKWKTYLYYEISNFSNQIIAILKLAGTYTLVIILLPVYLNLRLRCFYCLIFFYSILFIRNTQLLDFWWVDFRFSLSLRQLLPVSVDCLFLLFWLHPFVFF